MAALFAVVRRSFALRVAVVLTIPAMAALTPAPAMAATFLPTDAAQLVADVQTATTNGQDDVIDLGGNTISLTTPVAADQGLPTITGDSGHKLTIKNGTIRRSTAARSSPTPRRVRVPTSFRAVGP